MGERLETLKAELERFGEASGGAIDTPPWNRRSAHKRDDVAVRHDGRLMHSLGAASSYSSPTSISDEEFNLIRPRC